MIRPAALLFALFAVLLPSLGCGDECVQLADQICQCEATARGRQACQLDYQNQQEGQPAPSPTQLDACRAALQTCTCEALDQNRTDQCGFARGDVP